jgi:hypothetical protein
MDNQLDAIATVSPRDLWAVGRSRSGSGLFGCPEGPPDFGAPTPLVEHFDGSVWQVAAVPTPSTPSLYGVALRAVDASSPTDVWAVGGSLIENFDGSTWHLAGHLITQPGKKAGYGLEGVSALSRADVWAVGSIIRFRRYQPIIQHFDGRRWRIFDPNHRGVLDGISAIAQDNVWAVGYAGHDTLVEHFDGTRWQVVPSPESPLGGTTGMSQLHSVVTISRRNVWAVGYSFQRSPLRPQPLIEHFDGTHWEVVTSPVLTNAKLLGVAGDSPSDIYAVGTAGTRTLIEHFDGHAWTLIRSPNVPTVPNGLQGIGVVSGQVWATGWHVYQDARLQALVEHSIS